MQELLNISWLPVGVVALLFKGGPLYAKYRQVFRKWFGEEVAEIAGVGCGSVEEELAGLREEVRRGFEENRIQHTEMMEKLDAHDKRIELLEKKL